MGWYTVVLEVELSAKLCMLLPKTTMLVKVLLVLTQNIMFEIHFGEESDVEIFFPSE